MGHNVFAIIVAAIAIYAIEFVIFAVLISAPSNTWRGSASPKTRCRATTARMPFGVVMPILHGDRAFARR